MLPQFTGLPHIGQATYVLIGGEQRYTCWQVVSVHAVLYDNACAAELSEVH